MAFGSKSSLPVVILLTLGITAASSTRMFRHVDLGSNGKIVLGKRFKRLKEVSEPVHDGTYHLKRDVFSGAKDIAVHIDGQGRVSCIRFDYDRSVTFSDAVASYIKSLGSELVTTNAAVLTAVWRDKRTLFAILSPKDGIVYSLLIDRAWCPEWNGATCSCSEGAG